MPAWGESLAAIVAALADHYGIPAAARLEPFPALVTVLLARASSPAKTERGCAALADAGLLDLDAVAEADSAELRDAIKSSGITVAPRALVPVQRLARWLVERFPGCGDRDLADRLGSLDTESLRSELASLRGIGPATADALLLEALGRPVYPVDRATYRILIRHGWLEPGASYDEARAVVEGPCPDDPVTLRRLAEWLAQTGSAFCRARAVDCARCPLRGFLPETGPIEPELFTMD
jgi:endonuclease-3 related protein